VDDRGLASAARSADEIMGGTIAMASKSSTVLNSNTESALSGTPGAPLRNNDETDLPSVAVVLEDSILGPDREFPLRRERIDFIESDKYRVALVHIEKTSKAAGGNAQPFAAMEHVLVLPLTWRELMVLVRAGVGHSDSGRAGREVRFGQIRVDFSSMEVSRADRPVALTALEFKALAFLVQNPERVISRDELLNEVWGYDNYPCTRTVDNHILKLRQKLERDASHPVHFLTVHRVGYKFVP